MPITIEDHMARYINEKCEPYGSVEGWLDRYYQWPKTSGKRINLYRSFNSQRWSNIHIEETDEGCYQKTKIIKDRVSQALIDSAEFEQKLTLTEFFIEVWGGVTRKVVNRGEDNCKYYENLVKSRLNITDKNESIYTYRNRNGNAANTNRYKLTDVSKNKFGSVSSWSKFLAIAYPDWAHIYDARVAYSINAIIYLNKLTDSKLWPIPSGVNSRIGLIDIETLIISSQASERNLRSTIEDLEETSNFVSMLRKTLYVDKDSAYLEYLSLLEKVNDRLNTNSYPIASTGGDIEAFLFMVADLDIFDDVLSSVT